MRKRRNFFGPSKDEIWKQIAHDLGADFVEGNFWKTDALRYNHGDWEIVLDLFAQSSGQTTMQYTRMRAPFVNKDGFRFKVYRENLLTSIGKFFGMQDIVVDHRVFDEQFIVKSNKAEQVKKLLMDDHLIELIQQQPYIHFSIEDDEGTFKKQFPEGVDMLYFVRAGVMKNPEELKALFELFTTTLNRLVKIGSAYEDDPDVRVK